MKKIDRDLLEVVPGSRITVLAIGSEVRGDDIAGIEIIRNLKEKLDSSRIQLIEANVAPENFTSKIRDFAPTHVIILDAIDFGGEAGSIISVDPKSIKGSKVSTHRLPLSVLIDYLKGQLEIELDLIGIQPERTGLNSSKSPEVEKAIKNLTEYLIEKLSNLQDTA